MENNKNSTLLKWLQSSACLSVLGYSALLLCAQEKPLPPPTAPTQQVDPSHAEPTQKNVQKELLKAPIEAVSAETKTSEPQAEVKQASELHPSEKDDEVKKKKEGFISLDRLDRVQQVTLLMQAELEQKKVANQLNELSKDKGAAKTPLYLSSEEKDMDDAAQVRQNQVILQAIYGSQESKKALVAYGKNRAMLELQVGDLLPNQEKVVEVSSQFLVLEFEGKQRHLTF